MSTERRCPTYSRYRLGGRWYSFELKECHKLGAIPVAKIDGARMMNLSLRESIFTKMQVEEYAKFQNCRGPKRATLWRLLK
jgi:hypothetical protein